MTRPLECLRLWIFVVLGDIVGASRLWLPLFCNCVAELKLLSVAHDHVAKSARSTSMAESWPPDDIDQHSRSSPSSNLSTSTSLIIIRVM